MMCAKVTESPTRGALHRSQASAGPSKLQACCCEHTAGTQFTPAVLPGPRGLRELPAAQVLTLRGQACVAPLGRVPALASR